MKRSREEMQNFINQLPECGPCKMENNEVPTKRIRLDDEMQSFLPQIHMPEYGPVTCQIDNKSLEKLHQDVTSIRTNLEKRRSKVTLNQLNEKVDMILTILQSWNS